MKECNGNEACADLLDVADPEFTADRKSNKTKRYVRKHIGDSRVALLKNAKAIWADDETGDEIPRYVRQVNRLDNARQQQTADHRGRKT